MCLRGRDLLGFFSLSLLHFLSPICPETQRDQRRGRKPALPKRHSIGVNPESFTNEKKEKSCTKRNLATVARKSPGLIGLLTLFTGSNSSAVWASQRHRQQMVGKDILENGTKTG